MDTPGKQILGTGIASLDSLLGGGIPARQCVIVTGNPGTGKTILCSQIAFAFAARGERVVLATAASEAHDKLLDALQDFRFFNPEVIGDAIYLVSAYPWLQKGPKEAKDLLLRAVRDRRASLLFIDGLRSLRDLWGNEAKLREFMYEINVGLAQANAIGLLTTEHDLPRLMQLPEATTVDGIIALSTRRYGGRVVRRAEVVKLRGRGHLSGEHLMNITRDGIEITPRLEEVTTVVRPFAPTDRRAAFGLPELDAMLGGGFPAQSATLMAGSTGVGKSLLSLSFAAAGARAGERSLYVTYSEPVERLVHRARGTGLDVQPLVDAGMLRIDYQATTNVEADHLIASLLRSVDELGAERVVIDGVGEIEAGILDEGRAHGLLNALIIGLRDRRVTSIFVKEVAQIAGPELDFSDTAVAAAAENVLFLRHVELRGSLHRILSILKMRESAFDAQLREFDITGSGIRVHRAVDDAEGILTGVGRSIGEGSRR